MPRAPRSYLKLPCRVSGFWARAPVSLARELGETVRAIRVMARRSGFRHRVSRLIRYLERL